MITLYYAPRTRAVRVRWLLEELGLPYALRRVEFVQPSSRFFSQATPGGKLPAIEDGEVTIGESGAILEYILERYGEGRLAPPVGSPARGRYLALALTAYAGAEARERVLAAGYRGYLTKPVEATELVAAVARLARPPADG